MGVKGGEGALKAGNKRSVGIQQLLLMKRSKGEQQKGEECTICMQRTPNSSINGCSHRFCLRCIRRWSKNKNTCPLCRERYHEIRTRNRIIEVNPPTTVYRPPRAPVLPPASQTHRRIVYVPMLLYPQQNCLFFQPAAYFLAPQGTDDASGVRYSLGSPAFFIPTL